MKKKEIEKIVFEIVLEYAKWKNINFNPLSAKKKPLINLGFGIIDNTLIYALIEKRFNNIRILGNISFLDINFASIQEMIDNVIHYQKQALNYESKKNQGNN